MTPHVCGLRVGLCAAVALGVGCDGELEDGIVEPSLDAKGDELGGVEDAGALVFGGEASGVFDRDFQFIGYTFEAREGAEVTIEVTQKGSAAGLDTTLFLYALGDEPRSVAVDDDGGFGVLSRIDRSRLLDAGRHAVVVGTKDATGRGKFRLTLACDSGECGPVSAPEILCPEAMRSGMISCLHDASAEHELAARFDQLLTDGCATETDLRALLESVCADTTAPFCEGGDAIAACEAFAIASYPAPDRAAALLARVDEPTMRELVDAAHASHVCAQLGEDASCAFEGRVFRYDATQSIALEELLAHARGGLDSGPGVAAQQDLVDSPELAFGQFMAFFGTEAQGGTLLDALGLELAQARVATAFGEFQFAGGSCQADLVVVQFPATGVVLAFDVLSCAG